MPNQFSWQQSICDVSPALDFDSAVEDCVELAGAWVQHYIYGFDNQDDFLTHVKSQQRDYALAILADYEAWLEFVGRTLAAIHLLPESEEVW